MSDTDKILQAIAEMQKDIHGLRNEVRSLNLEVKNVDLKVEAFHNEQTKANTEIISAIFEAIDVNATDTEKRLIRIEKHLNLPPHNNG
jgi:hypothetical protein